MSEVLARRQEGGRGEEVAGRRHEAGGAACEVLPWVHVWSAMMSIWSRAVSVSFFDTFNFLRRCKPNQRLIPPSCLCLVELIACTHVLHPSHLRALHHLPSRP